MKPRLMREEFEALDKSAQARLDGTLSAAEARARGLLLMQQVRDHYHLSPEDEAELDRMAA
eukprot:15508151-Heterocapsa_arctica.AAC.1